MANERDEVHPFSSRADAPYWEGLGRGELLIQRCAACRRWNWPADWRCPRCGSYELGWEGVEPRGVVYSWIRTHLPFVAAYSDLVPYVNVLVELPHAGGARLMGLLTGSEEGIEAGVEVIGSFQPPTPRTLDLPVLTWRIGGEA